MESQISHNELISSSIRAVYSVCEEDINSGYNFYARTIGFLTQ